MPVLATLLFGAALMQDPSAPGAAYAACLDRASGVTSEMRDCSAAEYERQDQALNATYRDLMARLPAELKTELRDAQRAWIGFRDAECDYRSLAQGGGDPRPAGPGQLLARPDDGAGRPPARRAGDRHRARRAVLTRSGPQAAPATRARSAVIRSATFRRSSGVSQSPFTTIF